MKKSLAIILCLAGLLSFAALLRAEPAAAPVSDTASEQTKTVILTGSELDYPPYAIVDENGRPKGFSVDLFRAVCKEAGLKPDFTVRPWDTLRSMLENGELDALPLVSYSKERDEVFDFTMPHTVSYGVVFRHKSAKDIRSVHDIRGKPIVVMKGDAAHDWLIRNDMSQNLVLTSSVGESLKMINEGKYDYAIAPRLVGLYLKKELALDNIEATEPLLDAYGRGYGFAVKQGDFERLSQLNNALAVVKQNGTYDRIYNKWFIHLLPKPLFTEKVMRILLWVLIASVLLVIIGFLWIFALRRTVARQTALLSRDKKELEKLVDKRAGEIRLQHQTLEQIIRITRTGAWQWNTQTGEIAFNDEQAYMFGYKPEELEPDISTWEKLLFPEDLKKHIALTTELVKGKAENFKSEYRVKHKDGSVVWVDCIGKVVSRTHDGKAEWVYGAMHDITDDKNHEIELEKFKMISDQASYGCGIATNDGSIVYVNESWAEMHGYAREELIGKSLLFFHPEHAHEKIKELNKGFEKPSGGFTNAKMIHKHRDGHEFITQMIASATMDDNSNPVYLTATITDITKQEEQQRQLRQQERDFKNLFENAISGIAVHELVFDENSKVCDYIYLQANGAFETHTGIKKQDVVLKKASEIFSGETPYLDIYAGVVQTGEPVTFEDYFPPLEKDFSIVAYPVGPNRFGTVFEDITERKKLASDLVHQKEMAEQANNAKSRFLANMSHELRTPLNSINGFSEMIAAEMLGPVSDEYKEYAANINKSGTHLLAIISDIIDMSKVEAGQIRLDKSDVKIEKLYRETVTLLQGFLSRHQAQVDAQIDPKATINGDEIRLKQIIVNLVTNAVKFAPGTTVVFKAEHHGDNVVLKVIDNGIGMTEDDIEVALKPFEQVEATYLTRTTEGTGLGLPLTVELIKLHNGTFDISSAPGKGTTITVTLPAS